jgi:hypothetical protein
MDIFKEASEMCLAEQVVPKVQGAEYSNFGHWLEINFAILAPS